MNISIIKDFSAKLRNPRHWPGATTEIRKLIADELDALIATTPPEAAEQTYAELLTEFNADHDADLKRLKSILGESWQVGTKWVDAVEDRVKELEAELHRERTSDCGKTWKQLYDEAVSDDMDDAQQQISALKAEVERLKERCAAAECKLMRTLHYYDVNDVDALNTEVERLRRELGEAVEAIRNFTSSGNEPYTVAQTWYERLQEIAKKHSGAHQ